MKLKKAIKDAGEEYDEYEEPKPRKKKKKIKKRRRRYIRKGYLDLLDEAGDI